MNLEKIIEVSHKIADPYVKSAEAWKFCCKVLAFLLILSIGANIYLATKGVEILVEQDYQYSNDNVNDIG
jgi:hypothetical protein